MIRLRACAALLSRTAALAIIVVFAPSGAARAQTSSSVRPLEYTRFVLPNGLVAILNEDHASPLVAVRGRDAVDPPLKVVTGWLPSAR